MKFTIPFDQCASKRDKIKKWSGNRIALTDRYRNAKHDAHLTAYAQARERRWTAIPAERGVRVEFTVYFPSGRQKDPANYTEVLLDALEGVAYENDSQVIDMCVRLGGYDRDDPRVEIVVEESSRERPRPPSRQRRR